MKNVKKLIAEISLYNDEIMELEQQNLLQQSDKKFFCELVKEYQEKSKEKSRNLLAYKKELQEIIENQELLDGRISKAASERKEKLEKEIEILTREVEIDNKNKEEANSSVKEILESKLSIENKQKIKEYQEKIQSNKEELQVIYDDCKEKITSISSKIEEKENSLTNVTDKDEKRKIIKELNDLYDKEEKYFTVYKDIIKLIDEKQVLEVKEVEQNVELTKVQREKLEKKPNKNQNTNGKNKSDINFSKEEIEIVEKEKKAMANIYKLIDETSTHDSVLEEQKVAVTEKNAVQQSNGNEEIEADLIDENDATFKEVLKSAKNVAVDLGESAVNLFGKIKNIAKAPKNLNELILKKIKLGNVKVNAGTQVSLDEPSKTK